MISLNFKMIYLSLSVFLIDLSSAANTITLYTDSNYEGRSQRITVTETCTSPVPVSGGISSINPGTSCVYIYTELGCSGNFSVIKIRTPSKKLRNWTGFENGIIRSIKSCEPEEPCIPSSVEATNITTNVLLYDHDRFLGQTSEIQVHHGKCTIIPKRMSRRLSSLRMQNKVCLEVYTNWDCSGDSAQLRINSPFQYRLTEWGMNDIAKSVSYCGLTCGQYEVIGQPVLPTLSNPESSIATLYDEVDLKGVQNHLFFPTRDTCIDIKDEWEGESMSIDIHGGCFVVYELHGCISDEKYLCLNATNENDQKKLSQVQFEDRIRSIQPCKRDDDVKESTIIIVDDIINITRSSSTSSNNKSTSRSSSTGVILLIVLVIIVGVIFAAGFIYYFYILPKRNQNRHPHRRGDAWAELLNQQSDVNF